MPFQWTCERGGNSGERSTEENTVYYTKGWSYTRHAVLSHQQLHFYTTACSGHYQNIKGLHIWYSVRKTTDYGQWYRKCFHGVMMISFCQVLIMCTSVLSQEGRILDVFLHDDINKRKLFPRYWPSVRGIHRSPVNSPKKGQWRGALMFSLIWTWTNGWVNTRGAGDFRHHHTHYDVTVMAFWHYHYLERVCKVRN